MTTTLTQTRSSVKDGLVRLMLIFLLLTALLVKNADVALAATNFTITSPSNGASITSSSPVTITGNYNNQYDIKIAFNSGNFADVTMTPDGLNSGTWSYTWDPSSYNGQVEIIVRGSAGDTRSWEFIPRITVNVNIANKVPPVLSSISPADGASISGATNQVIAVSGSDDEGFANVTAQVRVNLGAWQNAPYNAGSGKWEYAWAVPSGAKIHAIQAKLTDSDNNVTKSLTNYIKVDGGTAAGSGSFHSERALWVWDSPTFLNAANTNAKNVLKSFMDDPSNQLGTTHKFKTMYFSLDPDQIDAQLSEIKTFVSWAHANNYIVHALLAGTQTSYFFGYSKYHAKALAEIEAVLNYNASAAANERFDGVNIDYEPFVITTRTNPTTTINDFLTNTNNLRNDTFDMYQKMMQRKAAAGQSISVGPITPWWMDADANCLSVTWNGNTKNCASHIQDTTDYITVLTYRESATQATVGIIPAAQGEINYAGSIGKKAYVAAETGRTADTSDGELISFYEEGRTYMESQLDQVYTNFASNPGFGGVAIHYELTNRRMMTIWKNTGTKWTYSGTDTVPPTTPSSLSASTVNYEKVNVSWTSSTDVDSLVDYYEVHRSTTSNFTPSSSTLIARVSGPGYQDWGLVPNTTYYYKVKAVDIKANVSAVSTQAFATTQNATGLTRMHIASVTWTPQNNGAIAAQVKVVDSSGTALGTVMVYGSWGAAAGGQWNGWTVANGASKGTISKTTTEVTQAPYSSSAPYSYIVRFIPDRMWRNTTSYWASSEDSATLQVGDKYHYSEYVRTN